MGLNKGIAPIVFLSIVSLTFLNFLRQGVTAESLLFILMGVGAAIAAIHAAFVYNKKDVPIPAIITLVFGAVAPFGLFLFSYIALVVGIVTVLVKRDKATTETLLVTFAGIGLAVIGILINLDQHGVLGW